MKELKDLVEGDVNKSDKNKYIESNEKGISFGCPRARMHSWQQRKRYERGSAQCLNV